jgi:uncharacterized GH25 family protein
MKKILLASGVALVLFLVVPISEAHDLWLVPQKFRINPGEHVKIFANTGMDFPKSLGAITPDRIDQFVLMGKEERSDFSEFSEVENSLVVDCLLKNAGTYTVAAALKPKEIELTAEEFNDYLLHDGLPNIYELRKKEGLLYKDAIEHYSKYPKTIIQAGDVWDDSPTQPLGLTIEIVPKVNPYSLKLKDDLKIIVLFRGKPLPHLDLAWSYPGHGEEFAGSTKTNQNGEAIVPLTKAGPYVIRLTHMEWVKKQTHEWESYWASLTFEVLEK